MTTPTIPVGAKGEYLGDRYDRIRSACEELASDPGMQDTDSIYGTAGIRAFTTSLVDARLLDGLSDHDADTVALLVLLDFTRGPERMAWRLTDWMNEERRTVGRADDDTAAVVAVLALSLGLVMSAFAASEFGEASTVARMFEKH